MKTNNTTINVKSLVYFVAMYADAYIGTATNGEETTLTDEISIVARMIARGDVARIEVDPYRHSRLAYAMAEMSESQKAAQMRRNYTRAANKILWLNTICRRETGANFISRKINKADWNDIEDLCDSFEKAMRYPVVE